MNTRRRFTMTRFLAAGFLAGSLAISGCGPGQMLGPTLTPTDTPTPIPTNTPTPVPSDTPTPTPTATITPTPGPVARVQSLYNGALKGLDICSGKAVESGTVGTSAVKKVLPCDVLSGYSLALTLNGLKLLAEEPSEVWYVLELRTISSNDLKCTGSSKGKTFTYTYPGRYQIVYSLRDIHSGKVVSSRTLTSGSPQCVWDTCSLNTATNTANCRGGEAKPPEYGDILQKWLSEAAK